MNTEIPTLILLEQKTRDIIIILFMTQIFFQALILTPLILIYLMRTAMATLNGLWEKVHNLIAENIKSLINHQLNQSLNG